MINRKSISACAAKGISCCKPSMANFAPSVWRPGTITHIPPMWAHRVVNTGDDMLVFVASYHLSAGHDYAPIIERGFRKLVVERAGEPALVDSDRWEQG